MQPGQYEEVLRRNGYFHKIVVDIEEQRLIIEAEGYL